MKSSNRSSPGPNGIPYLVYKKLPCCAILLFKILSRIFKTQQIPKCFGKAFISLIPKDPNNLNDVSRFRPIAGLTVEGKIFLYILSRRLIEFCRCNGYLPGKIQKGFLPGIAGCIELSAVLYAALLDAKKHKHTIIITWLDLVNAYGSVNHNLLQFALQWYHVPKWYRNFVFTHYESLYAKVVTNEWSTAVFPFLIGVFQGDPASPIHFNIVYHMCVDYVKQHVINPFVFSDKNFDLHNRFW